METDSVSWEPGIRIPEARDVYYPPWFEGTFTANSKCVCVWAPLGIEAFGGQGSWKAGQTDLNTSLVYDTKFVSDTSVTGNIIADRLFNVQSIARASMGPECVIPQRQPDEDLARRLHLVLSPSVGLDIYDIDLIPTDREFRLGSQPGTFEVMERTAQIITTRMEQLKEIPSKPFRKDIETIVQYTQKDPNTIAALQRTATFLTKVDSRYEQAVARNPAVATRAIDIRLYEIIYSKRI